MESSVTDMALKTDREKCAHLLRRFGLGASEAELEWYLKDGYSGAIDKLLNYEQTEEGFDIDIDSLRPANQNNLPIQIVQLWWILRLVMTQRPLQEKMTLFWHDHFATSAQKVSASLMMLRQNEIFRSNATGDFKTLLAESSKDPAMLFWLDNQFNVKGKPNENFAREIMELFTLGVDNYTEHDIQEAARAFTGWTIRRGARPVNPNASGRLPQNVSFFFNRNQHDSGVKDILGNKGEFDGDDVIGILCGNPQTAKYLTTKIWEWFAYPNPEPKLIDGLASKFRDSGLKLKVLLRAVMDSPEFYSAKAERSLYKSPADYCIAIMRQLGVGSILKRTALAQAAEGRARLVPAAAAQQAMKAMGMELLFPPDVAGWESGASWVSSATMVERIQFADRLFPLQAAPGARGQRGKAVFRYPIMELIAENPTPQHLADTLLSIFNTDFPESKKKAVHDAAARFGPRLTAQTAPQAANAAARLIFGSPEFQFS